MGKDEYKSLLIRGFIYEPPKCPDEFLENGPGYIQEWIITDYGKKYIKNLGITKHWKAKFPFSIYYKLKNK